MAKRKFISQRMRFATLHRFGFRCAYCGQSSSVKQLVVDHLIPVAHGGDEREGNLVAACAECNAGKSDLILQVLPDTPALTRYFRRSPSVRKISAKPQDHSLWDREEAIAASLLQFLGVEPISADTTPWNVPYSDETSLSGTIGHISQETPVRASMAAIRNLAGEE